MSDESIWSDFQSDYDMDDKLARTAVYDYAPTGALLLQYEKDEAFTSILRQVVDEGFLTWSKDPYCWVIDADFAEDVLKSCRAFFDYVIHGDIEQRKQRGREQRK